MIKTKYNIETSFIDGYKIVDPVNQATYQSQKKLSFVGNTITIDLNLSNFFMVDTGECPTSEIEINIINYEKVVRFELLMLESVIPKTINWGNITPNLIFPYSYGDDDNPNNEPDSMEPYLRRQMLISFKTVKNKNNEYHFLGIPSIWFTSRTSHSVYGFFFEEKYGTNTMDIEVLPFPPGSAPPETETQTFHRGPNNCYVRLVLADDYDVEIEKSYSVNGLCAVLPARVPDYLDYDMKCLLYNSHHEIVEEVLITAEESRTRIEPFDLAHRLQRIPMWETGDDVLPYRVDARVELNSNYYLCNGYIDPNGGQISLITHREPDLWNPDLGIYDRLDWCKWIDDGWYIWVKDESPGSQPGDYTWERIEEQNQPDPPL